MQRTSFDEYLPSPVGRWSCGRGWLHFCLAKPSIAGAVMWGTVDFASAEAILACASAAGAHMPDVHVALIDGRRVRSVEAIGFKLGAEWIIRNHTRLGERVTQLAGVRPTGGLIGAAAEGYFKVVPAPYPVMMFAERGESLAWLGCEELLPMVDDLEKQALAIEDAGDLLQDLHRFVAEHPTDVVPEQVARSLGMSLRSLQRHLRAEGTTFQREVTTARVRLTQAKMLESEETLGRIAMDVGFASPAMFSVAFRKLVGVSPSEWRESARMAEEKKRSDG